MPVTTVQAGGGGVRVWGMFSWHTLGPLVPSFKGIMILNGLFLSTDTQLCSVTMVLKCLKYDWNNFKKGKVQYPITL